jgi:hypothetical protein
MTRALIAAGLLAFVGTTHLHGQSQPMPQQPAGAALPQVYKPEQLTPVQLQARNAVSTLRDSVAAAGGALSRLAADVQSTSLQVLESRANTIVDRCAAAERQRIVSEKELSTAALSTPGELKAQKDMLKEMGKLQKSLDLCKKTYTPLAQSGKGQELRDYGPSRAQPIIKSFQAFDQSLKPFSKAMNIQFRPLLNAGKSPLD